MVPGFWFLVSGVQAQSAIRNPHAAIIGCLAGYVGVHRGMNGGESFRNISGPAPGPQCVGAIRGEQQLGTACAMSRLPD